MTENHQTAPALLDYQQAARLLNIKLGTLYAMVSQRRVPHIRLAGRLVRFDRDQLLAWVRSKAID